MDRFTASTQYGDWKGSVSADNTDRLSIDGFLKEKGLLDESEFLIAVSFYNSEGFTRIRAFVFADASKFESVKQGLEKTKDPVPVRELSIELTPIEFIELFKRLSVMLCWNRLGIEGRTYSVIEE